MQHTPPTENLPLIRLPRWEARQPPPPPAVAPHPSTGPVPTSTIFTRDWLLNNLVGAQIQGAWDHQLNQAMYRFAEHLKGPPTPPPVNDAPAGLLEEIARLRGRDPAEIKAEYAKFQELFAQAYGPGLDPQGRPKEAYEPLDASHHRSFMANETQLRYGLVVGQALGVDPVFGAMLNPTGGLVGPGNTAFDLDGDPVGYHGITHDAAGYLYNHHGVGPGYDYLHRERDQGGFGVNTGHPFTGQREGIRFWRTEMPSDMPGILDDRAQVIVDVGFRAAQIGTGAWDVGKEVVETAGHAAKAVGEGLATAGKWLSHAVVDRDISNPWIM